MSQEVSGPRRAVWDQADMQVRVSAYDGDCNVGDDEGKSVTRVSDVWILGSYACWILEHRKHQKPNGLVYAAAAGCGASQRMV